MSAPCKICGHGFDRHEFDGCSHRTQAGTRCHCNLNAAGMLRRIGQRMPWDPLSPPVTPERSAP